MEIEYKGKLSDSEIKQGLELLLFPTKPSNVKLLGLSVILFINAIIFSVGAIIIYTTGSPLFWILTIPAIIYSFLGIIFLSVKNVDHSIVSSWKYLQEGIITENEIIHTTETSKSTYAWNNFTGYGKGSYLFILLRGNILALIFPRRSFKSPEDWEKVQDLLNRKLPLLYNVNSQVGKNTKITTIISIGIIILLLAYFFFSQI
jgi:hypothetical protein